MCWLHPRTLNNQNDVTVMTPIHRISVQEIKALLKVLHSLAEDKVLGDI